ncbi:MAG: hypothetical protein HeimC3_22650 [Candidatus Heimdallarchaeota archaeon LC_3]|nr:MAG: hypothetical protein HeimC3_22650 [Candidatus Heimdallarchaeota archaeon LC_3]
MRMKLKIPDDVSEEEVVLLIKALSNEDSLIKNADLARGDATIILISTIATSLLSSLLYDTIKKVLSIANTKLKRHDIELTLKDKNKEIKITTETDKEIQKKLKSLESS